MVRRPTAGAQRKVTSENLQNLGAAKLAEILVSVAETRPDLKRRLRMELAAEQGPSALAPEIDKRLFAFETSRGKVTWRQKPAVLRDLDALRGLIVDRLAPLDRAAAADRLWRFMASARQVQTRIRERGDELDAVYARAAADLGRLLAQLDPGPAAANLIEGLASYPSGWKSWLAALLPQTSPSFAALSLKFMKERPSKAPGWIALTRQLAEAAGDVDAFRATYSAEALKTPYVAAEVAKLFLNAGRLQEAGEILRSAAPAFDRQDRTTAIDFDWETAWIEFLQQSGDLAAAQSVRWASFQRTLAAERLRAHLDLLPDFDDVAAEHQALEAAANHQDVRGGLRFLIEWPALAEAGRMIEARADEISVEAEEAELWAAKLRRRQPRAAHLLLRKAAADAFARRLFKDCDRLTAEAETISLASG
jgi:hypothetical protein